MSYAEHVEKARTLRDSPMIKAWIAAYQADRPSAWGIHEDCRSCGFPHSKYALCGSGATFGTLTLGRDRYSIDISNVVWFHGFMMKLGQDWGFHWRNHTFFKRDDEGCVEVRFIEQYNNSPQIKTWRIPPAEWASIVASVSGTGETSESYREALKFHGWPDK